MYNAKTTDQTIHGFDWRRGGSSVRNPQDDDNGFIVNWRFLWTSASPPCLVLMGRLDQVILQKQVPLIRPSTYLTLIAPRPP